MTVRAPWTRAGAIRGGVVGTRAYWRRMERACGCSLDADERQRIWQIAQRCRAEAAMIRDEEPPNVVAKELGALEEKVAKLEHALRNLSGQSTDAIAPYLEHFSQRRGKSVAYDEIDAALYCFKSALVHARADLEARHRPDEFSILKSAMSDLACVYEAATGNRATYSQTPNGDQIGGPFVRFVEIFVAGLGRDARRAPPGKQRRFAPLDVAGVVKRWRDKHPFSRD